MDYRSRQKKIDQLFVEQGLEALVLCGTRNLRFFSGFTGSEGCLIFVREQTVFLTDSRYTTQAEQEVQADHVEQYKVKRQGILDALKRLDAGVIGFEADLPYHQVTELQEAGASTWEWKSLQEPLAELRLQKEPGEIAAMERAAGLHAAAFAEIRPLLRPGAVERDIAVQLEFSLKSRGAEEKAFDYIVASGPRGSMPHGIASDRRLGEGELVTIDFGCRVDGYHSDETITVAVGQVPANLRRIYDTVLEAHDRTIAAVEPGIPLVELDRIARDYIAEQGYGEYFGHGVGHGIGLAVHEAPVVSPRAEKEAAPGMVFTVEPGIYIPDVGGVRIEDMVLVTATGHRTLTSLPKNFVDLLVD